MSIHPERSAFYVSGKEPGKSVTEQNTLEHYTLHYLTQDRLIERKSSSLSQTDDVAAFKQILLHCLRYLDENSNRAAEMHRFPVVKSKSENYIPVFSS